LAIVRYPHIEILVVGSVILFAVALVRRQVLLAGIFFVVALTTREDAGFHVFAILFVVVALNRWYGIPWRQQAPEIGFAAFALTYSVAVVVLQRSISTAPSTLTLTYLGDPPFANLTATTVLIRLLFYATYRAYLVLPAIIAAIWAARTRNPYIVAGYLAFLPWGLLHLVASTDLAGTLSFYYGYPFMIAAFWPLLGVLLDPRRRSIEGGAAIPVLALSVMVAGSFGGIAQQYNPGRLDLLRGFLSPPTLQRQEMTDRAVAQLAQSKPALGVVVADTSIVALAPDRFAPGETVPQQAPTRPDTVIYFAEGYESATARLIAATAGLTQHYRVPETAIRIATNRPIAALAPVSALLAATDASD